MVKILIQIKDNTIYFKAKKKLDASHNNLLNTNVICDNELVFSDEYIYENMAIVTSFIKNLVTENNIDTAVIYNNGLVLEILDVLKNISKIKILVLKDDVPLSYKVCEKICKTSIKAVSCYNLQDFLVEIFDKSDIVVESRNEMFFTSRFMINNDLLKYSSIFYKKSLIIDLPLSEDDTDDFNAFCSINKYLKVIHINKTVKRDLEALINILEHNRKKNIKIIIHQDVNDFELVTYIKKINNISKKKYNIKISISYSDAYLGKNFLPQANLNILKVCLIIIIIIVGGSFGYVAVNNYFAYHKDLDIKEDIQEIIDNTDPTKIIEENFSDPSREIKNDYIASLMTFNKDTTAWITVKNTNVDYPVLQAEDNDYYLNHNIEHDYDFNGWVFMDFRNNKFMEDDNTILYGHTNYDSSVMFGSLKNISSEEWRSNPDNLIIEVDTVYDSLEYEIFAYYNIPVTHDYITTNFSNDIDKLEFFKELQSRSEYTFDVELTSSDTILTLSTCSYGGAKRLVVHAVLID